MVINFEDSVDDMISAYDEMVDDENHETSQNIVDITNDVITRMEESEEVQEAINEVKGYIGTLNAWINQDDWITV